MAAGAARATMDGMTTAHRTHPPGSLKFLSVFTLAHAAVAFPTLRLWAEYCARRKRMRW